jgi:hypothetical protein
MGWGERVFPGACAIDVYQIHGIATLRISSCKDHLPGERISKAVNLKSANS